MTHIEIAKNRIVISGHCGYAENGKDIVCSAISTLSEATYNYLKVTGNDVDVVESDAYYEIIMNKLNSSGQCIIKEFINMIDDLIKQYGNYIEKEQI